MDSINAIVKDLRKDAFSVRARLQSIIHDNRFVSEFEKYPLIANERCGLWYVQPHQRHGSAYFKSTDGHTGQWKFSLRRLNFHLLPIIGGNNVIVLVDSTRKGKLMPDALLKTVPIWCAVVNYIMFEGEVVDSSLEALKQVNWLTTPREMVSESEHHAIVDKIPGFAHEVLKLKLISKEEIIKRLGARKPIIPQWVYPGKVTVEENDLYFSICCLTALAAKICDWNYNLQYIQGAADDHELWATKDIAGGQFDHAVFWKEVYYEPSEDLRVIDMATGDLYSWLSEAQLIERINKIHQNIEKVEIMVDLEPLGNTGLHLGKISGNCPLNVLKKCVPGLSEVIVLSQHFEVSEIPKQPGIIIKVVQVESSKKGSKQLRDLLPKIMDDYVPGKITLVLCDTGTDLGAGVCLCFLPRWFDNEWKLVKSPLHVNKDIIKQHLSRIQDFCRVNPSRNTLQSVNTYLMGNWQS